jgi:hypothetical protein
MHAKDVIKYLVVVDLIQASTASFDVAVPPDAYAATGAADATMLEVARSL